MLDSSIDGMKQLLRTISETADLIKNEQPQKDANQEITEVHIKQAIEELGMSRFDQLTTRYGFFLQEQTC